MGRLRPAYFVAREEVRDMTALQRQINRLTGVSGRGGRVTAARRMQSAMRARAAAS